MSIVTTEIDDPKLHAIKNRTESHFCDFKSKRVAPGQLSKAICAFANADGGELYIGIEDPSHGWQWDGFANEEAANAHIAVFDQLFPLGDGFRYTFLAHHSHVGLVLWIEIDKASRIHRSTDDTIYARRGAQNLRLDSDEQIKRLQYNKGISSFEDQTMQADLEEICNSCKVIDFMIDIVPDVEPEIWLKKQRLIVSEKPIVAGIVLFSDEPQVYLPKTAIKIYRYRTTENEGNRAAMEFDPLSVDGCAYEQIFAAVSKVKTIAENIPIVGSEGLEKIQYPQVAVHEIVTNAVLHRDYSLNDDIHIRIFDDRIEVESPGRLPAHITEKNILTERFARNPKLVRLINKFKNPPNKDVGEGLNTSFKAMRDLRLREPIIEQRESSVLVTLRHEQLDSSEEAIIKYLKENDEINNTEARRICFIGDANKMKKVFQNMIKAGLIERIEGRAQVKAAYRRGKNFEA